MLRTPLEVLVFYTEASNVETHREEDYTPCIGRKKDHHIR
jgi:hypothetical protein